MVKKYNLKDTNKYITNDNDDLKIYSGGALTYSAGAASTWSISGDLTLDSTNDIILDADGADISLKDGGTQFLKFTNNSGNCEIYNGVADKDIIFKDLGGNEICRIDGSAESLLINSSKKIEFKDTNKYITNDNDDLKIYSGGALTYSAGAASTWSISGDLTLDSTNDIILDADGADISLKDDGTQFLKFTNNSGNCEIYNGVADKDIIFKDLGGNEICRIDGSAESLLINSSKKIQFRNTGSYINSDNEGYLNVYGGTGVNINIAGNDIFKVEQNSASVISQVTVILI